MESALEVLKECRKKSRLITDINNGTSIIKTQLEAEINKSLIQSIRLNPTASSWLVCIDITEERLALFGDCKNFLEFIYRHVKLPEGFKHVLGGSFTSYSPNYAIAVLREDV